MDYLSLQKAGQVNGKVIDNSTVELSAYSLSNVPTGGIEKCTFEISMLSSSSLDLVGTSYGWGVLPVLKKTETQAALQLGASSFINFGRLNFSTTGDFTFEIWLRIPSDMYAESGCLIQVGDKASNMIMFSVSNGKFVLTGIEKSLLEDILTFDVDDVDDFPSTANAKKSKAVGNTSRFRSFALQNASNNGKQLVIAPR